MTSTEVAYRVHPLAEDDIDRVSRLSQALGTAETIADWRRLVTREGAVAVCADTGGVLVGYAAGTIRAAYGMPGATGWIESFGVDLGARGHGLGRALLAALLQGFRSQGATAVRTLVAPHDRSMAPFFRELGFREELVSCLGRQL